MCSITRYAEVRGVLDIRGCGMLAGVDIDPNLVGISGYELQKKLFDCGLHIKTTGNTALLAPPLVCSTDDLDFMVETLCAALTKNT